MSIHYTPENFSATLAVFPTAIVVPTLEITFRAGEVVYDHMADGPRPGIAWVEPPGNPFGAGELVRAEGAIVHPRQHILHSRKIVSMMADLDPLRPWYAASIGGLRAWGKLEHGDEPLPSLIIGLGSFERGCVDRGFHRVPELSHSLLGPDAEPVLCNDWGTWGYGLCFLFLRPAPSADLG